MFRVSKFEKFDGRAVLGDECDADTVGEAVRGNQDFAACKLGGEVTLIHPQGKMCIRDRFLSALRRQERPTLGTPSDSGIGVSTSGASPTPCHSKNVK